MSATLDLSAKSKSEFLASLNSPADRNALISHNDFASTLLSVPEDNFTAAEWNKIADFALNQLSEWQAEWLFSSARAPDRKAQGETEAWESLWNTVADQLTNAIPEVKGSLQERKDLVLTERILERKLQQDNGRVAARFKSLAMSYSAHILNALGFKGAARKLMAGALYPAGTVGRAQC